MASPSRTSRSRGYLAILALGAAIVVTAVGQHRLSARLGALEDQLSELLATRGSSSAATVRTRLPDRPVSLVDAAIEGDANAAVAILEYTDFHCPYCRRFADDTLPDIKRRYLTTRRVLFALKHLPLDGLHPLAQRASEAAACAGRQHRFWEMHDWLFANPGVVDEGSLTRQAETLGLEARRFGACLVTRETEPRIRAHAAEARAFGITWTPTFLLGEIRDGALRVTQRISGAQPFAVFAQALDELLEQAPR